jgi:Flp pilus assembly protein TadB
MKALGTLRLTLIALLLVSTTAFLVGVLAERSSDDEHHEPAAVVQDQAESTHNEAAETSEAGDAEANDAAEGREGEHREPSDKGEAALRETGEHDAEARRLGIDPESTPLLATAVAAGLALTVLAASRMGTSRAFFVVVALAALVWAALDIREIAHQIDESRSSIAAIAAVVAALHLAAAAVASFLARSPGVRGRGAS